MTLKDEFKNLQDQSAELHKRVDLLEETLKEIYAIYSKHHAIYSKDEDKIVKERTDRLENIKNKVYGKS